MIICFLISVCVSRADINNDLNKTLKSIDTNLSLTKNHETPFITGDFNGDKIMDVLILAENAKEKDDWALLLLLGKANGSWKHELLKKHRPDISMAETGQIVVKGC